MHTYGGGAFTACEGGQESGGKGAPPQAVQIGRYIFRARHNLYFVMSIGHGDTEPVV